MSHSSYCLQLLASSGENDSVLLPFVADLFASAFNQECAQHQSRLSQPDGRDDLCPFEQTSDCQVSYDYLIADGHRFCVIYDSTACFSMESQLLHPHQQCPFTLPGLQP